MATLYTRTFNFKDSLSDEEVLEQWQFLLDKCVPAVENVKGVRTVKLYSGSGTTSVSTPPSTVRARRSTKV